MTRYEKFVGRIYVRGIYVCARALLRLLSS